MSLATAGAADQGGRAIRMADDRAPQRPAGKDPRELIRAQALKLGFDVIGFCGASLPEEAHERLRAFLAAGFHGDMGWLATRAEERAQPSALWPEARSVVVVGMNYAPPDDSLAFIGKPSHGNLSVYARNRDYHDLIKGRLKHLAQFMVARLGYAVKVFVDTAPVMEKPLAEQAGIGWQGKHTNIVSRSHGSWLFLGEIYTDAPIQPDDAATAHCGQCERCISICPTKAFVAPYKLDGRRCISYLTIEHKGPIPVDLRKAMGNRIYGCDDCLAVCPWNKFARPVTEPALTPRADLCGPLLADLVALDDAAFRARFSASPVKRIGRDRFIRNVLVAIGNSNDVSLLPAAQALLTDPDPVVAEAAAWACAALTGSDASRPVPFGGQL